MIEGLEGRVFTDRPFRICSEKVAEFVDATGDDPRRWTSAAPPGFAAALLFVVAPDLLSNPAVEGAVVHGDQSFTWFEPLTVETDLLVTGTVSRVRKRGDTAFVNFLLEARDENDVMLEGRSTFLVGGSFGAVSEEIPPIPVEERGESELAGTSLPSPRSASRSDLVRYAAATRDWNPIHWDHTSAVAAGLGGVVVHGLLQSSWLTQVAALIGPVDRPLDSAHYRYKAPLRPGAEARVEGVVDDVEPELRLMKGDEVTVTGRFAVAT